jgi:NTP pyrophosphatase (non-canonical NTP hydrolase)
MLSSYTAWLRHVSRWHGLPLCTNIGHKKERAKLSGMSENPVGDFPYLRERRPELEQRTHILTPNEYQELALKTVNPNLDFNEVLSMCGLGLSGESGEVADMLKKHLYHFNGERSIDHTRYTQELGDIMWYVAVLAATLSIPLENVMQQNIAKLAARHGDKFKATYKSDSGDSL